MGKKIPEEPKEGWLDIGSLPDDPKHDPRLMKYYKYRAFDKY